MSYEQPQPGQQPTTTTTDGLSIAALVTGLLGLGVVPIILGIMGLRRIRNDGTGGRGLAIAGIVLGGLEVVAAVTLIAILLVVIVTPGSTS